MNVLFIIDHLRGDGTQNFLLKLAKGLQKGDFQVSVLCLNDSYHSEIVEELKIAGVQVHILSRVILCGVLTWLAPILWIKRGQFDVCVCLLFWSDALGRVFAKLAGVPRLITSIRGINEDYSSWKKCWLRLTSRWIDHFVAPTELAKEFALEHEGLRSDCASIIPNGVDSPAVAASNIDVKETLGLAQGTVLLGSGGRLSSEKGYQYLIQGFAKLKEPNVHLVIFGEGQERQRLQQLCTDLGISDKVSLPGHRSDFKNCLSSIDIYIQPSLSEGMPNALMEAMARGIPVVASDIAGIRVLVKTGENGLLVPPQDAERLAEKLSLLLQDRNVAQEMGQRARALIEREYSTQSMTERWVEVLR